MGEVVTVAFDIVYSSKQSVGFTHVYYACSVVEHSRQLKVGSMSCAQRFGEAIQFHRFILAFKHGLLSKTRGYKCMPGETVRIHSSAFLIITSDHKLLMINYKLTHNDHT